jgi:hypothetical protein
MAMVKSIALHREYGGIWDAAHIAERQVESPVSWELLLRRSVASEIN